MGIAFNTIWVYNIGIKDKGEEKMKANVYLKNLVNGEEINYGEVWQIKKYSVKKLKKMTDEEKLSKAVMVCKRLNALVQKRYWKHTPQYEYIARVE